MAASETLPVSLPAAVAEALLEAVHKGEYPDVDAALADAGSRWVNRHEEAAEAAAWVRTRIHASLDDPRPSLSMEDVETHVEAVFANARKRRDAAA